MCEWIMQATCLRQGIQLLYHLSMCFSFHLPLEATLLWAFYLTTLFSSAFLCTSYWTTLSLTASLCASNWTSFFRLPFLALLTELPSSGYLHTGLPYPICLSMRFALNLLFKVLLSKHFSQTSLFRTPFYVLLI